MTDAQIIKSLQEFAFEMQTKHREVSEYILLQAAARITELSIIHHTWHPSVEEIERGL